MWLFTPDGFYSPRYDEFCNKDEVMIRARCEDDLVRLANVLKKKKLHFPVEAYCPPTGYNDNDFKIIELPLSDYLYRMKINKNDWAAYCSDAALDERPTSVTGGLKNDEKIDNRYMAYMYIWETMILFQDYSDAKKKGDVKQMREFDKIFDSMYYIEEEKDKVDYRLQDNVLGS